MNYFNDCNNIAEAKAQYWKLAKIWHPDTPLGNGHIFKEIVIQYENFIPECAKEQMTHEKYGKLFSKQLNLLIQVENVIITVIGCWIWVETINGVRYKREFWSDYLTEDFKIKWNNTRKLWQIMPEGFRHFKSSDIERDKDELMNFYGGSKFNAKKELA